METMLLPPDIMEHARGTKILDPADPSHLSLGIAAYKSKLYATHLEQASASEYKSRPFVKEQRRK